MTVLGGAQEVGRSAFLIKTRESSVCLTAVLILVQTGLLKLFQDLIDQNSRLIH